MKEADEILVCDVKFIREQKFYSFFVQISFKFLWEDSIIKIVVDSEIVIP